MHRHAAYQRHNNPSFPDRLSKKRFPGMPSREQLEELLTTEPDDVFLNYALAKTLVSSGDLSAGLARFDRVLELDPKYVPGYFQKSQTLVEQGKKAEASDVLKCGINVARELGDTHAEGEMTAFLDTLSD
jgi:predicted Zn-dependent protease